MTNQVAVHRIYLIEGKKCSKERYLENLVEMSKITKAEMIIRLIDDSYGVWGQMSENVRISDE